jgi:outer membrane protein OmpA-like peptidoglycan-associated protein
MKTKIVILFALLIGAASLQAQVDVDVKGKVTNQADNRANKHTDNAIDKGFDKIEDGIKGLFKKKKNKKGEDESADDENAQAEGNSTNENENNQGENNAETADNTPKMDVQWSKFDFVPGDNVIFEDGPNINEENGEFPSRWDLEKGQVEIMNVNGGNVIGFIDGSPSIVPYLKNPEQDYLPDIFTLEFDIYRPASGNRFSLYLYDRKNQKYLDNSEIEINLNRADIGDIISEYNSGKDNEEGNWIHVSLAFTKGKLKVYLDENRVINIPHYESNPTGLSFQAYWADAAEGKAWYMKNIRIAEGGVKYYDRAIQDGKIIVNGIRFDVGKATLKPESMGPINEIYNLMNKNPEINFSVEGHTDSDGEEAHNQTLSEQRAKAVMDKLIEMGIDKSRLKSTGFGESKPIADNSSAEGKANNRRVEFVKF